MQNRFDAKVFNSVFFKKIVKWAYLSKKAQREAYKLLNPSPVKGDSVRLNLEDQELLITADAILPDLVKKDPYFAGWSSVLACVNDIYASGGKPVLIMNVVSSKDKKRFKKIFAGMSRMASVHNIFIAGGHSFLKNAESLSVFAIGKPFLKNRRFRPYAGNSFFIISDIHRGKKGTSHYPSWNSFDGLRPEKIIEKYRVIEDLFKAEMKIALKDVSGGGIFSAVLSFMEEHSRGITLYPEFIPVPEGLSTEYWFSCFPSFSFIGCSKKSDLQKIKLRCERANIVFSEIGKLTKKVELIVKFKNGEEILYRKGKSKGFLYF